VGLNPEEQVQADPRRWHEDEPLLELPEPSTDSVSGAVAGDGHVAVEPALLVENACTSRRPSALTAKTPRTTP